MSQFFAQFTPDQASGAFAAIPTAEEQQWIRDVCNSDIDAGDLREKLDCSYEMAIALRDLVKTGA